MDQKSQSPECKYKIDRSLKLKDFLNKIIEKKPKIIQD